MSCHTYLYVSKCVFTLHAPLSERRVLKTRANNWQPMQFATLILYSCQLLFDPLTSPVSFLLCNSAVPKSPHLGDTLGWSDIGTWQILHNFHWIVLLVSLARTIWPWQVGDFLPQTEPLNQGTHSDEWATVVFQAWGCWIAGINSTHQTPWEQGPKGFRPQNNESSWRS